MERVWDNEGKGREIRRKGGKGRHKGRNDGKGDDEIKDGGKMCKKRKRKGRKK